MLVDSGSVVDGCGILIGSCFNMPVACTLVSMAVEVSEAGTPGSKLINVTESWGPPPFIAVIRVAVTAAAPPACPTPNMVNRTVLSEGDR